MKTIILALFLFTSFVANAQLDSLTLTYSQNPISVVLPVKALVVYGAYASENPNWADRKLPDYLLSKIGSGTKPDSLVTVSMSAKQLAEFTIRLTSERYGAASTFNRSIFNNSPSIGGYTALFTQVTTKADGASSEKNAAVYVRERYNAYLQTMTDLYNAWYNKGLEFIRN